MEIASKRTGETDVEAKPARYAALGIPEYWRFDETSEFNGTMLAGDQPVDGQYEPVAIKEVEVGVLQGYSAALNVLIRWERGELRWHARRRGRKYPPSSRSGKLGWPNRKPGRQPRTGSESRRRNWRGGTGKD